MVSPLQNNDELPIEVLDDDRASFWWRTIERVYTHHLCRWRKLRRAAHEGFNVRACEDYQPLQEKESARLVHHMLEEPKEWDNHLKR